MIRTLGFLALSQKPDTVLLRIFAAEKSKKARSLSKTEVDGRRCGFANLRERELDRASDALFVFAYSHYHQTHKDSRLSPTLVPFRCASSICPLLCLVVTTSDCKLHDSLPLASSDRHWHLKLNQSLHLLLSLRWANSSQH